MVAITLTDSSIQNVKRALQARFSDYKSSHLTEALAAACGYKSHAALLADMKAGGISGSSPSCVLLDENSFFDRLEMLTDKLTSIGRRKSVFDELNYPSVEEVIKTSSPGLQKTNYAKSVRLRAWRNTIVAGINAGLDQHLFTVRPDDNRWPGATVDRRERKDPHVYYFRIGDIPAVASVNDAGYDELSIHVALWPTNEGNMWVRAAAAGSLAGEVYASGWLERRLGAWLQVANDSGRGWSFYCRKNRLGQIAALDIRPKGYADRGSFIL